MPIEITVHGKAEPGGSKKGFPTKRRNGSLGVSIVDANPNAKSWKRLVANAARKQYWGPQLESALSVTFTFYRPRPKGHYGTGRNAGIVKDSAPDYPTTKPDVLKLARVAEDALTGVVYRDDAQIVDEFLRKRYGEPARVEISISVMSPVFQEPQQELFHAQT